MIKQVEGFDKYIAVAGFKDVRIREVDQILNSARGRLDGVAVQLFAAKLVAGWQHLYFAALNALKAFKNKTNISRKLAVETLLYVAAQRQIRVALDLVGIKQDSRRIAVLLIADKERDAENSLEEISKLIPGKRDDNVLDLSKKKLENIRRLFGISETELASKLEKNGEKRALSDLVIEHVALLVTQR